MWSAQRKVLVGFILAIAIIGILLAFRLFGNKIEFGHKDREVMISSQIPNLSLKFSNKRLFLQKLDTISFWKAGRVADLRKQQEKYTAQKIAVILLPASQVPDPYFVNTDGNSRSLFAFGSTVDKAGLVTFYVGLEDIYLLEKNKQASENLINALLQDGVNIIANSAHLTTRTLEQVTSQSAPKYLELTITP